MYNPLVYNSRDYSSSRYYRLGTNIYLSYNSLYKASLIDREGYYLEVIERRIVFIL